MKFESKGIKCDNSVCTYEDMSVKREDYLTWLNKPCPKCGDNLLTQKDYDALIKLEKIMNNPIMKVFGFIDTIFQKVFFWVKPVEVEYKMNGTGKIKVEVHK